MRGRKSCSSGRKEHPERQDVYLQLAELNRINGNLADAAEQLKLGLTKATDTHLILEKLIDYQLQLGDLKAAHATCDQMKDKISRELLKFHEARIEFAEAKFLEASRDFETIRPAIARIPYKNYSQQLAVMLGTSYEQLGQWDRSLEVFRELLRAYPDILRARLGEAIALENLGRHNEASTSINALAGGLKDYPYLAPTVFQLLASAQLQKPAEQRDWTTVEKVADLVYQDKKRTELDNDLMKADILMFQDRNVEVQQIIDSGRHQVSQGHSQLDVAGPGCRRDEETAKKMPQLLDRAEKAVGDQVPLRSVADSRSHLAWR